MGIDRTEYEVQRLRNVILRRLADAAEAAQALAEDRGRMAMTSKGGQRAIAMSDRDVAIARSRALLDAAKIVREA